ncbi:MAG: helix-turn-helix domain-containing protein [Planctomycetaceae bacterium]
MSKKYLSLEEAADRLGIDKAELNRLREKGSVRAFADRGNWKFKEEDVENLARNQSLIADDDSKTFEMPTGDSSGDLIFSDDELSGTHPTLITKGGTSDSSSDSDVRLIFEDLPKSGARSGNLSSTGKSDSDVQLTKKESGSFTATRSDSDVKLVKSQPKAIGSDSDVKLVSSKSGGSSSNVLDDDGISLSPGSGVPLGGDSGISLEMPDDSGISLSHESVTLGGGDSGISLALDEDEGISLAETPILKDVEPKKPAPAKPAPAKGPKAAPIKAAIDDDDDLAATIPVLDQKKLLGSDDAIPVLGGSSGDVDAASSSETSVITLDDDSNEYDMVDSGSAEIAVEEEEEVDADLIGEDDEIAEDVFGAEDADFDEDLTSGESSSELSAPRAALAVEQDWGTWPLVGMALSTLLMLPLGVLMFDLVRNLWHTDVNSRNPMASMLLDLFK